MTSDSITEARKEFAEAFSREADPLAKYSDLFPDSPDPFEHFVKQVVETRDSIESEHTENGYRRTYRQWKNHMEATDRHPACPSIEHVQSFIKWRRDAHGNTRRTILGKLNRLEQAYEFWQTDSVFPHQEGYNPFILAKEMTDLGEDPDKEFHDLTLKTLRDRFAKITNIKRRALIGLMLKLGLRAGEVCNLKISDLHVSHREVQEVYPELGAHPALEDRTNALYVPYDRDGNKSWNPRLLPIDEELRWLLVRYLLVRVSVDEPYVLLSNRFSQMTTKGVNKEWKKAFHSEFAGTEEKKAITSHFGRHWFSTHWRLEATMAREHVQYMRGDRIQPIEEFADTIDDYLHPNYEHIEAEYRDSIFKLDLPMRHRVSE